MSGAGAGGGAWCRPFLTGAGAGADPIWSEPGSVPGPGNSGARVGAGIAQKSGGSATLVGIHMYHCICPRTPVIIQLLIDSCLFAMSKKLPLYKSKKII